MERGAVRVDQEVRVDLGTRRKQIFRRLAFAVDYSQAECGVARRYIGVADVLREECAIAKGTRHRYGHGVARRKHVANWYQLAMRGRRALSADERSRMTWDRLVTAVAPTHAS